MDYNMLTSNGDSAKVVFISVHIPIVLMKLRMAKLETIKVSISIAVRWDSKFLCFLKRWTSTLTTYLL